ncbi:hypothetical protein NP233_g6429 [Leucocoprinus birnbaumii]|uniref:H/ACA ribonucleoprotein complex non-core subunit NAF1 n=1 Tax=Leucocoprinus birnbaumii TaxID=56174 RepID=A0AAD5VTB8_9AGAR|nr:hypothetical protein NP233_g6429 [Leucocoprinus birnbaumii]
MATFKEPQLVSQDLLFISEFVDIPQELHPASTTPQDDSDDIASSGSENESEEEIEKDLTAIPDDEEDGGPDPMSSDSSSSSESDSSDSESEVELQPQASGRAKASAHDDDDDEETVPSSTAYLQTKNELVDAAITIPDLEEVGADEELEKVGEVMSVVDGIAIVCGLPSSVVNRGSERALDSDTLLVFGDRKVMGYIYETFGPTSQPMYQIKFNQSYPLDPNKVQVGREVFHVPRRSHFVFVNLIKQFKGSDASNVHDEEPGEDEIEFSDDEAEAAHRSRLKQKRTRDRSASVASSRHSTPTPSQMRDQDMMTESVLNKSAFDEHGPYDLDYGAGPSRPTPKPYDDPYSDSYSPTSLGGTSADYDSRMGSRPERPIKQDRSFSHSSQSHSRTRGRGRGRGRRGSDYARGSFARDGSHHHRSSVTSGVIDAYDPRMPQDSLPAPFMQAQSSPTFQFTPSMSSATWGYPDTSFGQMQNQQPYMFSGQSYQNPLVPPSTFVQPHINPRFASAFGFQMAATNSATNTSATPVPQGQGWTDQWTVPTMNPSAPKPDEPGSS